MLLWPDVCCFSFMNEQLKCMEMLSKNFLYSLEHTIGLRDQYILEVVVNNISNYATVASLCPTFNSNNIHQVITTFLFLLCVCVWAHQWFTYATHVINHFRPSVAFPYCKWWKPGWGLGMWLPNNSTLRSSAKTEICTFSGTAPTI